MRRTGSLSGHRPEVGRERARVRGTLAVPRLRRNHSVVNGLKRACATAASPSSAAADSLAADGTSARSDNGYRATPFLKTYRLAIVLLAFCSFLAAPASAVERFPPPDFSDHQLPVTAAPPPHFVANPYVDVALLALALALASYLAVGRRSRRGLFLLTLASLAWFGFVRNGCICPIGSIQNVTLAIFDPTYAVPWAVAAFFAPADSLYALLRSDFLCLGLSARGGTGTGGPVAGQCSGVGRPLARPLLLRLLGPGRVVFRHGHDVPDLPLRSVRRLLPPQRQREHADFRGVLPRDRCIHRPTVLPLPLSLRSDSQAGLAVLEVARENPARRVHPLPPVRRRVSLRRHPRAYGRSSGAGSAPRLAAGSLC